MIRENTSQIRRLSISRQLSDVLKSKRKSYYSSNDNRGQVSPSITTAHSISSAFTFLWNCATVEVNSLSKDNINISFKNSKQKTKSMIFKSLVKQKSISYDDMVFISSEDDNDDKQTMCTNTIDYKFKQNGLFFFSIACVCKIINNDDNRITTLFPLFSV